MTERQTFEDRFFKITAKCKTLMQESQFNPDIQVFQEIQQPPSSPQDNHCSQHPLFLSINATCLNEISTTKSKAAEKDGFKLPTEPVIIDYPAEGCKFVPMRG